MLEIGLTGGIGSGKSTVGGIFRELGAHIIDADRLAAEAVMPGGPAYDGVLRVFGSGILAPDGTVDRAALAGVVFADPVKRARLEAVVHPAVFEAEARAVAGIRGSDPDAVVVFDAALLFETGAYRRMDRVVVVWCGESVRVERLLRDGRLAPGDVRARMAAQMPLEEKAALADFVIDNGGSLERTRRQAAEVYREIAQYV